MTGVGGEGELILQADLFFFVFFFLQADLILQIRIKRVEDEEHRL